MEAPGNGLLRLTIIFLGGVGELLPNCPSALETDREKKHRVYHVAKKEIYAQTKVFRHFCVEKIV